MTGGIPMTEGAREGVAIRLLIVDDHDLFRTGMASLLGAQPDIKVVARASGGHMGVRLADELQPDVVLMDLRMPDLEGPDATREILAVRPQTRVLVFTVASDDADVAAALHSGACGFVAKDTSPNDVGAAIRAAAQGVAWLSPCAAEVVLRLVRTQNMQRESEPDPPSSSRLGSSTSSACRAGQGERGDRRGAVHQPADGQESRLQHPVQVGTVGETASGDVRSAMRIDLTRVGRRVAIWLRVCLQREAHREPALASWTITAGICGSSLPSRASSCTAFARPRPSAIRYRPLGAGVTMLGTSTPSRTISSISLRPCTR